MWPEAVTGRLAEPLHLTAAQPLAQQQQKTSDHKAVNSRQTFFARQYDTRLLVVLQILQNLTCSTLCLKSARL